MTQVEIKENNQRPYHAVSLDNFVDKDVQSVFLPFRIFQNVMICPKYTIKNDFMTPNNIKSNLFSLFGTIMFISAFTYRFYKSFSNSKNQTRAIYFAFCFEWFYYCTGFTINYFSTFLYSKKEVKFVLTLQKIHRLLNDKRTSTRYLIFNWVWLLSIIPCYIAFFTRLSLQITIPYYHLITITLLFFDFNTIFAIQFIKLLKFKLILWNIEAVNSHDYESTESKLKIENIFKAFMNVLKCYNMYKVMYQYRVRYLPI